MQIKFLLAAFIFTHSMGCARTWTNLDGKTFEGDYIRSNSEFVYIERTSDRKQFTVPKEALSEVDREYIKGRDVDKETSDFMAGNKKSFSELVKLSEKKKTPIYIIYRNKLPQDQFRKLVYLYLMRKEFSDKIKGRCILVIIDQKDEELERRVAGWIAANDAPSMLTFNGRYNQSIYTFPSSAKSETSFERFLGHVEEQLTHVEDNMRVIVQDKQLR